MRMQASMLSIHSPSSVTHCIRRANIFFRTAVFRDLGMRNMLLKSLHAHVDQAEFAHGLATGKLSLQSPERDPRERREKPSDPSSFAVSPILHKHKVGEACNIEIDTNMVRAHVLDHLFPSPLADFRMQAVHT